MCTVEIQSNLNMLKLESAVVKTVRLGVLWCYVPHCGGNESLSVLHVCIQCYLC